MFHCQVQPEVSEMTKADLYGMYITYPYVVLTLQLILFIIGTSLLFYIVYLLDWNWACNGQQGMEFQLSEDEKKITGVDVDIPLMNKGSESWEKHGI